MCSDPTDTAKPTIPDHAENARRLAELLFEKCRLLAYHQGGEVKSWLNPEEQEAELLRGYGVLESASLTFTVTYFKPSGKFYTHGYLEMPISDDLVSETGSIAMFRVANRLKQLRQESNLPGLNHSSWGNGSILVTHPWGCPCLLPPLEAE